MRIPFFRHIRRATYDENGDIILGEDVVPLEEESAATRKEPSITDVPVDDLSPAWTLDEPPAPEEIFDRNALVAASLAEAVDDQPHRRISDNLVTVRRHITEDVLEEGLRQYRASIASARPLLRTISEETRTGLRSLGRFLAQPVWIPVRRGGVKETSRGTLFLLDMIRFGATFAAIFVLLFLTLNYQSFWQISRSALAPFLSSPSFGSDDASLSSELKEKLKLLPSLATAGGSVEGDLLSVLPDVGPPENRLVIPTMDLNVPLVDPPYDALLRSDWPQVEQDIQTALQDGVVHYPGTANPGQAGNFFVTGHSSYYPWAPGKYKTIFARLHMLQPGDEYWVYFGGDKHRYVVRRTKEVSPGDITVLDQPTDERLSTLMTCTPVGTTLRRLIIIAEEVDPISGIPLKVGEQPEKPAPKINLESLPI